MSCWTLVAKPSWGLCPDEAGTEGRQRQVRVPQRVTQAG